MPRARIRFGFGQVLGLVGIALIVWGLTQPWLRVDLPSAWAVATSSQELPQEARSVIFAVGRPQEVTEAQGGQVAALGHHLGIADTGYDQHKWLVVVLGVLMLVALWGVFRSMAAGAAWEARAQAPLLAIPAFATLAGGGGVLWLMAPEPREAMRPELGLYYMAGGAVCLLIGSVLIGNRRRRIVDNFRDPVPPRRYQGNEHMTFSHGAWVPRQGTDTAPHREVEP